MNLHVPGIVKLADYRAPDFLVDTVELHFELDAKRTVVRNRMTIRRSDTAAPDAPLRLDGHRMELVSFALNGETLGPNRLELDKEELTVAGVPDSFTVEVVTAIYPSTNKTAHGLFAMGGKLATQCEAEGFRQITYFPDRPDVPARYRVTLSGDKTLYPVLLSNGNPVASGDGPDGRHWVTWEDPFAKPSYIFAVMAGDFGVLTDSFVTKSGRTVALGIYADRDAIPQCRFAMDVVKRSLQWDEEVFGLEYDLDRYNIVALTDWAGAMENKGLNLFGLDGIVTDPETTTDGDYVIIERIVGHEQFHNWTGNRVTCRDWFQLSLKEGLTRLRDQLFIESKLGSGAWRIETVMALRRNQFPEDDGPAAHPIKPDAFASIDNFYTNTIYDKGAEVIRMMSALLGWPAFRKGFDLYIARHDGQAVTTEEFVKAMEDASGRDLTQFRRWYHQAGRPRIEAKGSYDAAAHRYTLNLTQTCRSMPDKPAPQPFHIPIATGLIARDGTALTFRSGDAPAASSTVLEMTEATQSFVFDDVASEPVPSLLRGFSAPVTILADLADDDLAVLMAYDPDPFARWDAAQTLAIRLIRAQAKVHSSGGAMSVPESFAGAFEATLRDATIDPLLKAQILSLPDEPVLSEGLATIDLDGHMAARNFLRHTLATRFKDDLLAIYRANTEDGHAYVPDLPSISRRRIKNVALDLLAALGTPDIADLCLNQVKTAGNMTDQFEALATLTHTDTPQRDEALAWFYERWKTNDIVINKWFNAQALSRAPGAVQRIIALESHPVMDMTNMARGLAFYGGFFRQNRVAFHDSSGAGYKFLADRLLMIDAMGRSSSHYLMPQINQWRRYDPRRQALMKAQLERIAATEGISKSLRENVTRTLAAPA
ncbi:Aminopeptidase N [Alphaproteobacteria bacterium SO-S41]|nr:Aminopeptidase N [Alphaproteobacteria bacterium SO-S41]